MLKSNWLLQSDSTIWRKLTNWVYLMPPDLVEREGTCEKAWHFNRSHVLCTSLQEGSGASLWWTLWLYRRLWHITAAANYGQLGGCWLHQHCNTHYLTTSTIPAWWIWTSAVRNRHGILCSPEYFPLMIAAPRDAGAGNGLYLDLSNGSLSLLTHWLLCTIATRQLCCSS